MVEITGKVSCIICGKSLNIEYSNVPVCSINGKLSTNSVLDGVACVACGNYGSAVFDSLIGGPRLGFAICDDCFLLCVNKMSKIVEDAEWKKLLDESGKE